MQGGCRTALTYLHRRLAVRTFGALESADKRRLTEPLVLAERRLEAGRCPHRLRRLAGLGHAQGAVVDHVDDHPVIGLKHIVGMHVDTPIAAGELPVPAAWNDRSPDARPRERTAGDRDDGPVAVSSLARCHRRAEQHQFLECEFQTRRRSLLCHRGHRQGQKTGPEQRLRNVPRSAHESLRLPSMPSRTLPLTPWPGSCRIRPGSRPASRR